MLKKGKINIFIIGLIVLIGGFVGYKLLNNGETIVPVTIKDVDSFAQCLTENGMKMYGTEWCSHCKNQKARFGDSFQYIDYIDCDEEEDVCVAEGIRGYPTWKFEGNIYPGEKEFEELAALSGC